MHNDTPLGSTMHLKDLDRQATWTLGPSPAGRQERHLETVIRRAVNALLRRLQGARMQAGLPGRA